MMFTKLGRKAVSYFSSLPTSFLESPAISLALQAEMTGRLCSQDERPLDLQLDRTPTLHPQDVTPLCIGSVGWATGGGGEIKIKSLR